MAGKRISCVSLEIFTTNESKDKWCWCWHLFSQKSFRVKLLISKSKWESKRFCTNGGFVVFGWRPQPFGSNTSLWLQKHKQQCVGKVQTLWPNNNHKLTFLWVSVYRFTATQACTWKAWAPAPLYVEFTCSPQPRLFRKQNFFFLSIKHKWPKSPKYYLQQDECSNKGLSKTVLLVFRLVWQDMTKISKHLIMRHLFFAFHTHTAPKMSVHRRTY